MSHNTIRWTDKEIKFLKENFSIHGAGYCSIKLNRTIEAIRIKANRLNIKRDGFSRYKKKDSPKGYNHCYKCNQILPETDFYRKTKHGTYGKKSDICRSCSREKARHFYKKYKSNFFERRKKDPIHYIYVRLKASAKKRGIEFNLNEQDLRDKFVDYCPVFNIKLKFFDNSDNSPSVDRIDNNKGYCKENIFVVSTKANCLKNKSSVDDLKKLYEFYSKLQM
jgi:hypothetical protein